MPVQPRQTDTMAEVLVLINFEGDMEDELTVRSGDVVKNVTMASEEGWLAGELRGKRGIFPANFVKEVPATLTGDIKREPRSIRKTKKAKQARKCEVLFAYEPMNGDELTLVVGETVEVIGEIEDGWWLGQKNGRVGAFPSNFVKEIKEIIVCMKDGKHNEGKSRPKLTDATFTKEISQTASVRYKEKNEVEYCQVMFDYKAKAQDELDLNIGDVVKIMRKDTEDEGWWAGELKGRCGFFPDNFVMVIPSVDRLQAGDTHKPPARNISKEPSDKTEPSAMETGGPTKTKDNKTDTKDLRSNPPTKVKLPSLNKPVPPPIKDKPTKLLPKTNGDAAPPSPKPPEEKESELFDSVEVQTDKLSHPTANRAKPPQRRPPSGTVTAATEQDSSDKTEPESSAKRIQAEKPPALPKGTELITPPTKSDLHPKTPPPLRPAPPKVVVDGKSVFRKDDATVESLLAEVKELRTALELLQARHERDMQEMKEELREESNKREALQEEVQLLKLKQ